MELYEFSSNAEKFAAFNRAKYQVTLEQVEATNAFFEQSRAYIVPDNLGSVFDDYPEEIKYMSEKLQDLRHTSWNATGYNVQSFYQRMSESRQKGMFYYNERKRGLPQISYLDVYRGNEFFNDLYMHLGQYQLNNIWPGEQLHALWDGTLCGHSTDVQLFYNGLDVAHRQQLIDWHNNTMLEVLQRENDMGKKTNWFMDEV